MEIKRTKSDALKYVRWFAIISLVYFVFSGIMSYMKASGIEVYIIQYDVRNHKLIFEHIVNDGEGEQADESIEEEIEDVD